MVHVNVNPNLTYKKGDILLYKDTKKVRIDKVHLQPDGHFYDFTYFDILDASDKNDTLSQTIGQHLRKLPHESTKKEPSKNVLQKLKKALLASEIALIKGITLIEDILLDDEFNLYEGADKIT
jgi:hypothetical protein